MRSLNGANGVKRKMEIRPRRLTNGTLLYSRHHFEPGFLRRGCISSIFGFPNSPFSSVGHDEFGTLWSERFFTLESVEVIGVREGF